MTVKIVGEEGARPGLIKKAEDCKRELMQKYSLYSEEFWKFWESVVKDFPDSFVPARGRIDVIICVPSAFDFCSPKAMQMALESLKD